VRLTLRVDLFSKRTPSRVSRLRMAWLNAEGDTSSSAAAELNPLCSATFQNAINPSSCLSFILKIIFKRHAALGYFSLGR
jgi:hypothetical protein